MPDLLDIRAKSIIDEVIELEEPSRTKHIERACKEHPELRRRVQSLLSEMEENDLFLHEPSVNIAATPNEVSREEIGGHIGSYTLVELIGEGGFGSVYLAEQSQPVRRRVALKIIKLGMDTKQVIARFEAERQALALMDHPNIARVLDAGATHSGRPYFVMEFVHGEPITKYCDRKKLTLRQRLELFRDVCNAVQHAHQKGIIHRDLKPSNVLVSESDKGPLPKVIDFGIAKATAGRLTELTLQTEVHQLIGTPEYMSPEQAESSRTDIDTRSDVYSLGVLLYELLTGCAPFEKQRLQSAPFTEVQRILREEEPPRPSLRLATLSASSGNGRKPVTADSNIKPRGSSVLDIAQCRQMEPLPLTRAIRGDLDWIVLKCLEKDRRRRYAATSELADDVERYLSYEPVMATPPSRRYRVRKFVRRNRGSVLAATAVAIALVAGTVVSLVFAKNAARRTKELELVAKFQAEQFSGVDAETMGTRLRTDLLDKVREAAKQSGLSSDQADARVENIEVLLAGSDLTGLARNSLEVNFFEPALKAAERQFSDQPLVKAYLLQSMASSLYRLGLYDSAYRPLKDAKEIYLEFLGDKHPDSLQLIRDMGSLLLMQGKPAEADPYLVEAAEKCRRALGDERLETFASLHELAQLRMAQGDFGAAETLFRQALDGCQRVAGENDRQTLMTVSALGLLLQKQGKLTEAEPFLLNALQKRRVVLGDAHPETLTSINNVSVLYWSQGRMEEAEPYFREALEKTRRVLGEDHPNTLSALANMGLFFRTQGRLAEAESLYREVLAKRRRILGNEHPDTQTLVHNLGFLLQAQGKPVEAEVFCREALDTNRRILGEDHPETITSVNVMGLVLLSQGKLDEAEPLCREAFEKRQQRYGDEHSDTLISMTNLGALLVAQADPQAAIELLQPAEQFARSVFTGGNAIRLARFLTPLGVALAEMEEFEAAEKNLTEASQILNNAKGTLMRDRTEAWGGLVRLYDAWHDAMPGLGYDAKAVEWKQRLFSIQQSR